MKIVIHLDRRGLRPAFVPLAVALAVAALVFSWSARGGQASLPHTFQAGQVIRASEVNANLQALRDEVNDNDARIGSLSQLQTTAKTTLVAAVNETFSRSRTFFFSGLSGPVSGQANSWAPGTFLASTGQSGFGQNVEISFPVDLVAGRPYHGTFRVQARDDSTSLPAPPAVPGNLVLDAYWRFEGASTTVQIIQSQVVTIAIPGGAPADVTGSFSGTVPTPGPDLRGFKPTLLRRVEIWSNASTTAEGESHNTFTFEIDY